MCHSRPIDFKTVHACLQQPSYSHSPSYTRNICQPVTEIHGRHRCLRSAESGISLFLIRRRSTAVLVVYLKSGPTIDKLWQTISSSDSTIRSEELSVTSFRRQLMTELYNRAYFTHWHSFHCSTLTAYRQTVYIAINDATFKNGKKQRAFCRHWVPPSSYSWHCGTVLRRVERCWFSNGRQRFRSPGHYCCMTLNFHYCRKSLISCTIQWTSIFGSNQPTSWVND